VKLPPKPHRESETADLVRPIRVALNRLPGVRVWRNNSGVYRRITDDTKIRAGLGVGSADLVGVVKCEFMLVALEPFHSPTGRFFALEVKRRGQKPTDEQLAWLAVVRGEGGFACVVHDIAQALGAVQRCRMGQDI